MQDTYEAAFEAIGSLAGYRLYHEPNHIPCPWHGPVVTTIHDLSVLRHPEWHPADRVRWYERDFLAGLPRTEHFITVSEFTKREMIDLLGVEADRITPIPLGPRAACHPRPPDAVRNWLDAHSLPPNYLLFAGTLEPRKNLGGLLAAYARLPQTCRHRYPLLVAGAGGWGPDQLDELIAHHGLAGQVRPLGYVFDDDLVWLYAGACALVWPTFYEGFGLPPLECMATGTPVITSNAASLPEVVGDAGLLVDPHDEPGLAEAMRRVIEDSSLAATLSEKGLARSCGFSWRRCAVGHAAIYRRYEER
jgi:alpha-1,3-rhamnosyl/mannosyltransferase